MHRDTEEDFKKIFGFAESLLETSIKNEEELKEIIKEAHSQKQALHEHIEKLSKLSAELDNRIETKMSNKVSCISEDIAGKVLTEIKKARQYAEYAEKQYNNAALLLGISIFILFLAAAFCWYLSKSSL